MKFFLIALACIAAVSADVSEILPKKDYLPPNSVKVEEAAAAPVAVTTPAPQIALPESLFGQQAFYSAPAYTSGFAAGFPSYTNEFAAPAYTSGFAAPAYSAGLLNAYGAPALTNAYAAPALTNAYAAQAFAGAYGPALSNAYAAQFDSSIYPVPSPLFTAPASVYGAPSVLDAAPAHVLAEDGYHYKTPFDVNFLKKK